MKKLFAIILIMLLTVSVLGCVRADYEPDEPVYPAAKAEKSPDAEKQKAPTVSDTVPTVSEDAAPQATVPDKPAHPAEEQEKTPDAADTVPQVTVPVLMFHDVKTTPGGEWSMSADNFRSTLRFVIDNGYTPISFDRLVEYVDGRGDIPKKPVCITLDDGYFSNYRNVLPIVTELQAPVTVFMVCKTVREKGTVPPADENILYKMSAAELEIMDASPYADIQSHTYNLHGLNTSYSEVERNFSMPLETETEEQFKQIYTKDCKAADAVLDEIGERKYKVLSYPGGKYHEWIEQVLREQNYRVTVTSDDGRVNTVKKGDPESLFMLGRMNVNDSTTEQQLLNYLEKR